ncbi:MAG: endonuclease/exonuclease/phosphatase family protein [Sedimentisphaeraceae bacterium JB056]
MLHKPEVFLRKFRNYFNRSKWLVRLMKLPYASDRQKKPGIILVQIDALSKQQLEKAIESGRMPFLKNLITKQNYKIRTCYSGMPCSTPAVQGELFYGVRGCVPSFSFHDSKSKRTFAMFNPDDAEVIESRLKERGQGLFRDGSCYSNIYTGGAMEAHFCIADIGFAKVFRRWRTFSFAVGVLLHVFSLIRALALLFVETVIAFIDLFRGLIDGNNLWKELKFVPSRVGMCILLREIIVIGATMDIARGLPIIQANLMGYHEQSHRRGATSRFAHWTLKGIDNAIERLWKHSRRSLKDYELWVYSDHGQVDTVPYRRKYGESLNETVNKTLLQKHSAGKDSKTDYSPGFLERLGWHIHGLFQNRKSLHMKESGHINVTELGPFAQVYLDKDNRKNKLDAARKLLATSKIPLIFIPDSSGDVKVLTNDQEYWLSKQTGFFDNDFVPNEIVSDFMKCCNDVNSGDFIISGYQGKDRPYYTFAMENGSHGGISEQEYTAFFLAPKQFPIDDSKDHIRVGDIRNAAITLLGRSSYINDICEPEKLLSTRKQFRVMTYNVHSCVGTDGKLSPLRIAKVIEQYAPDIVALQELDVFRERSGHEDQAKIIAEILEMDHFFHPAVMLEDEKYGDAILSRFPMNLVKTDILPPTKRSKKMEPRGALWTEVEINGQKLQFFNTHLGLRSQEKKEQIRDLLSSKWLRAKSLNGPVIFCGDLNFTQWSNLYRKISGSMKAAIPTAGPLGSYCGRYPLVKIDHIFYDGPIELTDCRIADTDWARIASDHRPLVATFDMPNLCV